METSAPEACFGGCWPQQQEGAPLGITGGSAEWATRTANSARAVSSTIQFFDCQHLTITGNGTWTVVGRGGEPGTVGSALRQQSSQSFCVRRTASSHREPDILNSPSLTCCFPAVLRARFGCITVTIATSAAQGGAPSQSPHATGPNY